MDFAQQIENELDFYEEEGYFSNSMLEVLSTLFYDELALECLNMVFTAAENSKDPVKLREILINDAKEQIQVYGDLYPELTILRNALIRRFCESN